MDYIFENQEQIEQFKKWIRGKETAEEARAFDENRPMPAYCQSCHDRQSGPRLMQYRDDYLRSISDTYREDHERKEKEKAKEREKWQKKEAARRSSGSGEINWNAVASRDDRSDTISSGLSSLTETGSNLFFYDGSKDNKTVENRKRSFKDELDSQVEDRETAIGLLTKFFESEPDGKDKRTNRFRASSLRDKPDGKVVQSVEDDAGTLEDFAVAIEDMPEMEDGYDEYLAMKLATAGDNDGSASEWNSEDCSSEDFPID